MNILTERGKLVNGLNAGNFEFIIGLKLTDRTIFAVFGRVGLLSGRKLLGEGLDKSRLLLFALLPPLMCGLWL